MPDAKPIPYRLVEHPAAAGGAEETEVIAGLEDTPARVAPKYFYDELGCALYGAICRLPEYYPTRVERALFRLRRDEIAACLPREAQFVDLGAGDCAKAREWLPFVVPSRYVAVDIARDEVGSALARLAPDFPGIEMLGVITDFSTRLDLRDGLDPRPALFFYPGSSIGNFAPDDAVAFLAQVHELCASRAGSGLLIGVDGKKAKPVLDAAYDDPLGVTAAFNRNVLLHLNRRFGFDFALDGWTHRGFYNAQAGRIEMHLEAARPGRAPGRRPARLPRRRAHPHRELVQVHARGIRRGAAARGLRRRLRLVRRADAVPRLLRDRGQTTVMM